MAEIKPFRALRYDERQAGPLEDLIAPPYDVITPRRELYLAKSPHNVVHLTLPESDADAGRLFREWREQKILVPDEAGFWALSQDYVGPDGVARTRTGLVGSLQVEPYETGAVLPHERTHRGPKEGRLRILREVGAQLEPIFLLHEGRAAVRRPRAGAGPRGRGHPTLGGSARRLRSRRPSPVANYSSPTVTIGTRPLLPTTRRLGLRPAGMLVTRLRRRSRPGDLPHAPSLRHAAG